MKKLKANIWEFIDDDVIAAWADAELNKIHYGYQFKIVSIKKNGDAVIGITWDDTEECK